jgi:hypothetical protein
MSEATGTIYDGNGKRLRGDGNGPENALALMATIEHKTLLHDGPAGDDVVETVASDRFYLTPADLTETRKVPLSWMSELAQVLVAGGRVGVLSSDPASLKFVAGLLSRPDKVLADIRRSADAESSKASGNGTQSVGMLCDGTGVYLDGDKGEAAAWQADEQRHFKGFLNGSQAASARTGLLPTDRFYMMPADYVTRGALPVWIMAELMKALKSGGKVLVVAPNREAFDRLVRVVSEPEKLLLAIEPAAGHA